MQRCSPWQFRRSVQCSLSSAALLAFLCSMITHFDYTKFTPGDGYMECLKMQCFEMDMPKMVMNKMAEKQFEGLWPLVEFQTRGFIPPPPF